MARKKSTRGSGRGSKTPKGISRIDIDRQGTHGYMVRLCRQGEKTNVFFSDSKHGGKRKALVAAEKELKKLIRKLPPPDTSKNKMNVRNVSGKVGVYETNSGPADSPKDYLAYVASWTTKQGKRKKINFALAKYGKQTAWKLACFARENEISDRSEVISKYESATGKTVKLKGVSAKRKAAGKKATVKKKATKKKAAKSAKRKTTKKKVAKKKAVRKTAARKVTRKKSAAKKKARRKARR